MWIQGSTTNKPSSFAASSAIKATCCLVLIGCGLVSYWNSAEIKPLSHVGGGEISNNFTDEIAAASVQSERVRTELKRNQIARMRDAGCKVIKSHLDP